jgi:polysaccharide deacetylase 2 family uncharacterized protein YibQ
MKRLCEAVLSWFRLLRFRLRAGAVPLWWWDRSALRVLCCLAAVIALGAAFFFVTGDGGGSAPPPENGEESGSVSPGPPAESSAAGNPFHDEGRAGAVLYDESLDSALTDAARRADKALARVLARQGLQAPELMDAEIRYSRRGGLYPFLRVRVRPSSRSGGGDFFAAMTEELGRSAPGARLREEGANLYFVVVDNLVTHSIHYGPRPFPASADAGGPGKPRLIIVIDDVGENLAAARKVLALPYPVTLSVWPRSVYAAYTATLARENGRQVFLHQPMEADHANPRQIRSETLRVGVPRDELSEGLRDSLSQVPYAAGVNNHMGSRFTSDRASARAFCEELRLLRPDFLVLDSLTHGASVLYDEAREQGFAAFRRDVFLDDESGDHSKSAVLERLDRGLSLARRQGRAIVIGHPRPATLEALASWQGYRNGDVRIVPLTP